jgi:hypothetical protein
MSEVTGYVLRMSPGRLSVLDNNQSLSATFAEPVTDFEHGRNVPLICFVTDSYSMTKYIAFGRRGRIAGTDLRRLNLSGIIELSRPVALSSYARRIPKRNQVALLERLERGGLLTPLQFRELSDAIIATNDELGGLLRRYSSERRDRIEGLPSEVKEQLAFQKEAVGAALSLAGLDRAALHAWDPPSAGPALSFLQGLEQSRLREDTMILNDMYTMPGFDLVRRFVQGAAVFEGTGGVKLTVIVANRQPLEKLTGCDLVYFNETFRSFVMVQYKAMEKESDGQAIFRLPNAQLDEEIVRMENLLISLQPHAEPRDPRGYRLTWIPFFLKLCPRVVFQPDDVSLVPGMYIPLEKWKLLAVSKTLTGSRGGRGVTFDNVGRYLDNTGFIALVSDAWVGTTPTQSIALEEFVRETLTSGRAAVIAHRSTRDDTTP